MSAPGVPPRVIAHGGASAQAPEHTVAAYELALAEGADGLWLEVHLSRDGHPVVLAGFTLERTTDGAGAVRARTLRELKRLDAGRWAGRRFEGQRLQALGEVLERFRDRAQFWIELKGGPEVYPGIEERTVSLIEVYDVLDSSVVASVDPGALVEVRRLNPDLGTLSVVPAENAVPVLAGGAGPVRGVCAEAGRLTAPVVGAVRGAGLGCYAWLRGEPALASRLAALGVDGIVTRRPGAVRAVLRGRHPDIRC